MTQPPTARVVSDREFVLEHHFRAPAAKVFAAYTDPKLLAKWWTPKGGSMTIESMDARPGGGYRYLQTDARGQKSVFVGKYLEVHPVTRLVYTFAVEGQGNEIRATVQGGGFSASVLMVTRGNRQTVSMSTSRSDINSVSAELRRS